jgi:hypothetical protein
MFVMSRMPRRQPVNAPYAPVASARMRRVRSSAGTSIRSRSDPDPRHFAAAAAQLAPATAVRLTVPGERTPAP